MELYLGSRDQQKLQAWILNLLKKGLRRKRRDRGITFRKFLHIYSDKRCNNGHVLYRFRVVTTMTIKHQHPQLEFSLYRKVYIYCTLLAQQLRYPCIDTMLLKIAGVLYQIKLRTNLLFKPIGGQRTLDCQNVKQIRCVAD